MRQKPSQCDRWDGARCQLWHGPRGPDDLGVFARRSTITRPLADIRPLILFPPRLKHSLAPFPPALVMRGVEIGYYRSDEVTSQ